MEPKAYRDLIKAIRSAVNYIDSELKWAERHPSISGTVSFMCIGEMASLVRQYDEIRKQEMAELDARIKADKAKKAAKKAIEKEKAIKGRRTGSSPVLAERPAKRKAREAQTQLRVVK